MRRRNDIIMEYGTYMLAYFMSYIASCEALLSLRNIADARGAVSISALGERDGKFNGA